MFSSFASRNNNGGSRLFPSVPRGFSVHAFKNNTLPSHPPPSHPAIMAPVAPAPTQSRTASSGGLWTRQPSYRPPPSDAQRKQLPVAPPSQDRRLVHNPTTNHAWPVETKLSKSQKSYNIYHSLASDIYIYERSITSASLDDDLSSSPSSDSSSSDSDHFPHTATFASLEISSTRASSSNETLESTLLAPAPGTFSNVVSSAPPPLPAIAAPPRPASTRPKPETAKNITSSRPVIPPSLTRAESHIHRSISISRPVIPPIQLGSTPLDNFSDSDSETIVSDTHGDAMVVDMLGARWTAPPSYPYPGRSSTPFRRDSGDRVPSDSYRRDAPVISASASRDRPATRSAAPLPPRDDSPRTDDPAQPRAPPGLSGGVATPPDGTGSPPRAARDGASSTPANISSGSRPSPSSAPLARSPSTRPTPASSHPGPSVARNGETSPSSTLPPAQTAATALISSSPPWRDVRTPPPQRAGPTAPAQGVPTGAAQTSSPQGSPTATVPVGGALVVATSVKRSVRWTENLVCPSPVPPERRRKGWFNRRGDQLWTNDGQYKIPEPGQEYPLDLAHYPEPNTGWMNEEGVRIDMQHRLIPKPPLRPALKRTKPLTP